MSDRIIRASDFYSPMNEMQKPAKAKDLSCDVYFQLENDDSRVEAAFLKRACVTEPQGKLLLHIRLEASWTDDGSSEGAIESKVWFVIDDTDLENIKKHEAPRRELNLIRMIYVPAVRNPEKRLGATSNSLLARLIRSVNWKEQTKQSVEELLNNLNETLLSEDGLKKINDILSNDWQLYYQDERFSKVALTIDSINLSSLSNRIRSTFTSRASGRTFQPEEMGDGTRSLLYISNVASVLDIEQSILDQDNEGETEPIIAHNPPLLTLVAIEEPENHISPHLLGKLVGRLKSMGMLSNCQVILTSHSPAIVRRTDPESIRYVRLTPEKGVSTIQALELPDKNNFLEAYKYLKLAVQTYPELYFAQLVVLGEGASEEIIIPRFLGAKGYSLDEAGIVFVPLAGRFVHYLWKLLAQLNIPFITLLDLDRERSGGGWGRVSYVLKELHSIQYDVNVLPDGISDITSDGGLNPLLERNVENEEQAKALDDYLVELEQNHVFFSGPLDIDYLMLTYYSEYYKKILRGNEGPIIKNQENQKKKVQDYEPDNVKSSEYHQRALEATKAALKDGTGVTEGGSYSYTDKALMIWYVYFFLGRGKTTTHIQMFEALESNEDTLEAKRNKLLKNIPPVLNRLCEDAAKLLCIEVNK
ncbi:hypothetical protein LPAF129_19990 [Ligilactobacillus pabuli]|uniref:ATP-dependent endonuclease n=1 Tax=Ligilactobacillus pabuli TaxID=2886039 RepID=A0ABQ5JKB4_9LACO|nr:TOPRIM nucleotidyl transferase/hydrolase domain-containing protein [Ligilactobacillus pabuli]GKS82313.1 hypothetical protein LPAF129_19990 [Ligilactobacillus pabuli]